MDCKNNNKFINTVIKIVLIVIGYLVCDYVFHYDNYDQLMFCHDTFGEHCRLIAVPDSVGDIIKND